MSLIVWFASVYSALVALTAAPLLFATLFAINPPVMFTLAASDANKKPPLDVDWHENSPPPTVMSQFLKASDRRALEANETAHATNKTAGKYTVRQKERLHAK